MTGKQDVVSWIYSWLESRAPLLPLATSSTPKPEAISTSSSSQAGLARLERVRGCKKDMPFKILLNIECLQNSKVLECSNDFVRQE